MPAWRLRSGAQHWFIKAVADPAMAEAELDGLQALEGDALRVPGKGRCLASDAGAFLVLEWLPLAPVSAADERAFGAALAQLHAPRAVQPGWHRDNWIGGNPQRNRAAASWPQFFQRQRLAPQLQWAEQAGLPAADVAAVSEVMSQLPRWLPESPPLCLLHGDLWHGNRAMVDGQPAVFDPAVYYGDACVDLAMLCLFGAPGEAFWAGYASVRGDAMEELHIRQPVYDLYHWLNHFTLFGGAYLSAVRRCCRRLLDEEGA